MREHQMLRKRLVADIQRGDPQQKPEWCSWVSGSVFGFEGFAKGEADPWNFKDWKWPRDDISDMLSRTAQLARFSLGVSEVLTRTGAPSDRKLCPQSAKKNGKRKKKHGKDREEQENLARAKEAWQRAHGQEASHGRLFQIIQFVLMFGVFYCLSMSF